MLPFAPSAVDLPQLFIDLLLFNSELADLALGIRGQLTIAIDTTVLPDVTGYFPGYPILMPEYRTQKRQQGFSFGWGSFSHSKPKAVSEVSKCIKTAQEIRMSDSIKSIIVTSGAMFALIFGAGNLILPPQLGAQFSTDWILTSLGFTITAIVFPVLGFVAHARNQGGVHGLALPMGKVFSWMFPLLIYLIAVALPGPRTASVTYEVGVKPLFSVDPGVFSFFYFAGVLLIGWFRSSLLQFMGKFLNPLLVLTILTLIVASFFLPWTSPDDLL
jgi:hypothetical protein